MYFGFMGKHRKSYMWKIAFCHNSIKSKLDLCRRNAHKIQYQEKEGQIKAQIPLLLFSHTVISTLCDPMDCRSFTISRSLIKFMSIDLKVIQI